MISIVTAYYNRKQLFINTLQSIKQQNSKYLLEVIAVDDGSEPNERLEDLVSEFPFLKIIRLDKKNKWYHNSCIPFNIGFKAAKGDKIIIQNPECFHYGNLLEYTENNLTDNKYLSFGCFSLDKPSTSNIKEIIAENKLAEIIKKNDEIVKNDGEAGWYNHGKHRPEGFHFCTAITKKSLNELGGFDEIYALGIAYDDNEFIWRVRKKRMEVKFVDHEIVLHQNHYSVDSLSFQNRANKEKLENHNRTLYKEITRNKGFRANTAISNVPFSVKKYFIDPIIKLQRLKVKISARRRNRAIQNKVQQGVENNSLIKSQWKNPSLIPILIINFNQFTLLKKQIDFYITKGIENIVIIDNQSTYPPLLEYYNSIKNLVTIEYMDQNYGHMVMYKSSYLQDKYGKGFFVMTDADVVPNKKLPENFMKILLQNLIKYKYSIVKIGFALNLENIPSHYALRAEVLEWEKKFWEKLVTTDLYFAEIDTTFAMYKPYHFENFRNSSVQNAIRIAGDFTAEHGGWYIDSAKMTAEQKFYWELSNNSYSWKSDLEGTNDNYKIPLS